MWCVTCSFARMEHINTLRLFEASRTDLDGLFFLELWELKHLEECEECRHIREVFGRQSKEMNAKAKSAGAT
jgi:predicted anti-sigma-YlaC factor YlaD